MLFFFNNLSDLKLFLLYSLKINVKLNYLKPMGILIFYLLVMIFLWASIWKVFVKAGQPGWAILIPIYNVYVMTLIAKKPAWWLAIILLVPIANIVFIIMLINAIAKNFGKDSGFTVGLIFLGIVFWPILGFGDAKYIGAEAQSNDNVLDA